MSGTTTLPVMSPPTTMTSGRNTSWLLRNLRKQTSEPWMSVTKYKRTRRPPSVRRQAAPRGVDVVALPHAYGPADEEDHRADEQQSEDEVHRVAPVGPAEGRIVEGLVDDDREHDGLHRTGDRHDRDARDPSPDRGRCPLEEVGPPEGEHRRGDAGDQEGDRVHQ